MCPKYNFVVADIFNKDLLETSEYDCILLMEFLKHIEADLEVIKRIKPGSRVIATVPNFPATGHVRYFDSIKEVKNRYQYCFEECHIEEHLSSEGGTKYFILDCIR